MVEIPGSNNNKRGVYIGAFAEKRRSKHHEVSSKLIKKKAVDKITIKCYLRNAFTHSDLFRKRKGTVSLAGVLSKLGAGNSISHAIGGRESEAVKCVH